jgi:hypothetical protein
MNLTTELAAEFYRIIGSLLPRGDSWYFEFKAMSSHNTEWFVDDSRCLSLETSLLACLHPLSGVCFFERCI